MTLFGFGFSSQGRRRRHSNWKKTFGRKNFWVQIFGLKKILGPKENFGSKKMLGQKEIVGQKKIWVKKKKLVNTAYVSQL